MHRVRFGEKSAISAYNTSRTVPVRAIGNVNATHSDSGALNQRAGRRKSKSGTGPRFAIFPGVPSQESRDAKFDLEKPVAEEDASIVN